MLLSALHVCSRSERGQKAARGRPQQQRESQLAISLRLRMLLCIEVTRWFVSFTLLNNSTFHPGNFWLDGPGGAEENATEAIQFLVRHMPRRDMLLLFEMPYQFVEFILEHVRFALRTRGTSKQTCNEDSSVYSRVKTLVAAPFSGADVALQLYAAAVQNHT